MGRPSQDEANLESGYGDSKDDTSYILFFQESP